MDLTVFFLNEILLLKAQTFQNLKRVSLTLLHKSQRKYLAENF